MLVIVRSTTVLRPITRARFAGDGAEAQARVTSVGVYCKMKGTHGVKECRRVQKSARSAPSQLTPAEAALLGCGSLLRFVQARRAVKDGEQLKQCSIEVPSPIRNVETS